MTLVEATEVTKVFGEGRLATPVLHGVSLSVRAGELCLLMGPSGSGKTTLISILAGLLRPTSGRVDLCGVTISGATEEAITRVRRAHLGFVFQTYNLFPALTALENVSEILRLKGLSGETARARAGEALDRVGLGHRMHHRPGELSGGQKQRVAIARALAGEPSLIIGDEITAALDTGTAMGVVDLLRDQRTPTRAVLVVTHDHRLERFADRVVGLEDGRVVPKPSPRTSVGAGGTA